MRDPVDDVLKSEGPSVGAGAGIAVAGALSVAIGYWIDVDAVFLGGALVVLGGVVVYCVGVAHAARRSGAGWFRTLGRTVWRGISLVFHLGT